jgi:TPR repeat protein
MTASNDSRIRSLLRATTDHLKAITDYYRKIGFKGIVFLLISLAFMGAGIFVLGQKTIQAVKWAWSGLGSLDLIYTHQLAEAGDPKAMVKMTELYRAGGDGLPKDHHQAAIWDRKAAEAAELNHFDADHMLMLGTLLSPDEESEEGGKAIWLRKAADAGNQLAMEYMGSMYRDGEGGLPKDDVLAVSWYRKAANAGKYGMCELGTMYKEGRGGLPKDDAKAVYWYKRAAEAGDGDGMYELGTMYEEGRGGLPKDVAQAASWYRKSGKARSSLEKDDAKAVARYTRLAEAGDAEAMHELGTMYREGRGGLPKDIAKAVYWYKRAAEAGDGRSMWVLGIMYEQGKDGLSKDAAQSISWYRKAAKSDSYMAEEAKKALQRLGAN